MKSRSLFCFFPRELETIGPILGRLKQIILAGEGDCFHQSGFQVKCPFWQHIKTSNRLKASISASLKRPFFPSHSIPVFRLARSSAVAFS